MKIPRFFREPAIIACIASIIAGNIALHFIEKIETTLVAINIAFMTAYLICLFQMIAPDAWEIYRRKKLRKLAKEEGVLLLKLNRMFWDDFINLLPENERKRVRGSLADGRTTTLVPAEGCTFESKLRMERLH